ncbi:MAG: hypothetical protein PHQ22_07900 [Sulfuricurvum sp.]|nr:hypothetical protein [Sulfuricurvum sp.]MDD5387098.1 hypothetical protein [Sulfuricurvum sp.]
METIKNYINKIEGHFGWLITIIISLSIISYLLGLYLSTFKIQVIESLASLFKMLGSAGVTAAIFQVIIKSTAFMNVLKDTLDVDQRNWRKYSDNKIKDVLKAIQEAKNFVSISYNDDKTVSIKLAKKALITQQKEVNKILASDRTLEQSNILEKNYFVEESRITQTIVKNGSEISTFELDIRFFKKGKFVFRTETWTESQNIKYPKFEYFKNNGPDKRFSDYSFSSIYFNLTKKGKPVQENRYAPLNVIDSDYDDEKGFKVCFTIDDTFDENDFLTLSFSTTTKDTYSDENIQRIKDNIDPKPYSTTVAPVGVRIITIQEEVYGNGIDKSKIRPTLNIDSDTIDPTIETQSIFYKKYQWTIYYKDHQYEKIEYSVI